MANEPQLQQRAAQPYIGISARVTMDGFPAAIDKAFPEIFGWLEENGVALAGAPFVRYHVTGAELEIEMAAPVEAPVQADGHVHSGALPAGRYVTLRHVGPYDGLMAGHEALQQWAQEHDVALDSSDTAEGTAWRGCAEYYVVDPSAEPDPAKWEVELAYLAAQS